MTPEGDLMEQFLIDQWRPVHTVVPLQAGKLVVIDVDAEIVPLILCCWELGFWTQFSCQGGGAQDAYVTFSGWDTAERILELTGFAYYTKEILSGWDGEDRPLQLTSFPARLHNTEPAIELNLFDPGRNRSCLRWNPRHTPAITRRLGEL